MISNIFLPRQHYRARKYSYFENFPSHELTIDII